MKKFPRKIVAASVAMVAGAGSAFAQVNIDAVPIVPSVYAREIVATVGAPVNLTNLGNSTSVRTALGYALSSGEVRYVRMELANATFQGATATSSNANAAVGAVNGIGTSAVYFSITAPAAGILTTDTITVAANLRITGTASNVTVSYSLYDQPSQAATGGTTGRIVSKADRAFVNFGTSQNMTYTPANETINVEADPAFTRFLATGAGTTLLANLGAVDFALVPAPVPLKADGNAIALADLNATGATGTKLNVTGDFAGAANADGSYTGAALNRVYLSANANCGVVTVAASSVSATTAVFNVGANPTTGNQNLCYAPRTGTGAGANNFAAALAEASYTTALAPVSAAPTTYSVSAITPTGTANLTRNGTTLQSPLIQTTSGYIIRYALTNTGSVAAPYSCTTTAGPGSTVVTNGTVTGSIPSGGQAIIEGSSLPTFTGSPRGFLLCTVARPSAQVQGVYQVVNATTGSVAQTPMVRPGTN
jgi:hypothetical protein